MDSFLPTDYKEPETSGYMKLDEGTNTFRILGSAITGYEYWVTVNNKRTPKRVRMNETVQMGALEINPKTGELDIPKVFWAFPVWNYKAEKVQILELKQKTIRDAIRSLVGNKKWGAPTAYDIVVTRDDSTGKTKYTTTPDPKEEVDPKITAMFKSMYLNLNKLYDGGNPFVNDEIVKKEDNVKL